MNLILKYLVPHFTQVVQLYRNDQFLKFEMPKLLSESLTGILYTAHFMLEDISSSITPTKRTKSETHPWNDQRRVLFPTPSDPL